MSGRTPMTTSLGDFIVAAFDGAQQFSDDPGVVTRLATRAVQQMLRRARRGIPPEAQGVKAR